MSDETTHRDAPGNLVRRQIARSATDEVRPRPEGGYHQPFRFDESFAGFDGHFPGKAILPGVVQIMLVQAAFEARQGRPARLVQVHHAKYREIVRPGDLIDVAWIEDSIDGNVRCKATLTVNSTTVASLTLLLDDHRGSDHAA